MDIEYDNLPSSLQFEIAKTKRMHSMEDCFLETLVSKPNKKDEVEKDNLSQDDIISLKINTLLKKNRRPKKKISENDTMSPINIILNSPEDYYGENIIDIEENVQKEKKAKNTGKKKRRNSIKDSKLKKRKKTQSKSINGNSETKHHIKKKKTKKNIFDNIESKLNELGTSEIKEEDLTNRFEVLKRVRELSNKFIIDHMENTNDNFKEEKQKKKSTKKKKKETEIESGTYSFQREMNQLSKQYENLNIELYDEEPHSYIQSNIGSGKFLLSPNGKVEFFLEEPYEESSILNFEEMMKDKSTKRKGSLKRKKQPKITKKKEIKETTIDEPIQAWETDIPEENTNPMTPIEPIRSKLNLTPVLTPDSPIKGKPITFPSSKEPEKKQEQVSTEKVSEQQQTTPETKTTKSRSTSYKTEAKIINNLNSIIDKQQKTIANQKLELNRLTENLKKSNEKTNMFEVLSETLEKDLEQMKEVASSQTNTIKDTNKTLEKMATENEQIKDDFEKYKQEVREKYLLASEIKSQAKKRADLIIRDFMKTQVKQSENINISKENIELKQQIETLEEQIEEDKKRGDTLQDQLEKLNKDIEGLKLENEQLKQQEPKVVHVPIVQKDEKTPSEDLNQKEEGETIEKQQENKKELKEEEEEEENTTKEEEEKEEQSPTVETTNKDQKKPQQTNQRKSDAIINRLTQENRNLKNSQNSLKKSKEGLEKKIEDLNASLDTEKQKQLEQQQTIDDLNDKLTKSSKKLEKVTNLKTKKGSALEQTLRSAITELEKQVEFLNMKIKQRDQMNANKEQMILSQQMVISALKTGKTGVDDIDKKHKDEMETMNYYKNLIKEYINQCTITKKEKITPELPTIDTTYVDRADLTSNNFQVQEKLYKESSDTISKLQELVLYLKSRIVAGSYEESNEEIEKRKEEEAKKKAAEEERLMKVDIPTLPTEMKSNKILKGITLPIIPIDIRKTLWIQQHIAAGTVEVEFETNDLDELFEVPKRSEFADEDDNLISLLDNKRIYNFTVFLSTFPLQRVDEFYDVLITMDDKRLNYNSIRRLLVNLPTPEEKRILEMYDGPEHILDTIDLIFMKMLQVPRLKQRLHVWKFKFRFEEILKKVIPDMQLVIECCDVLLNNDLWFDLLRIILAVSNYLNNSSRTASASKSKNNMNYGFNLRGLSKLFLVTSDSVTLDDGTEYTLLHYIHRLISEQYDAINDWMNDLDIIRDVGEISHRQINDCVVEVKDGLELIQVELSSPAIEAYEANIRDQFIHYIRSFEPICIQGYNRLTNMQSVMHAKIKKVAEFYGEQITNEFVIDPSPFFYQIERFMDEYENVISSNLQSQDPLRRKKQSKIPLFNKFAIRKSGSTSTPASTPGSSSSSTPTQSFFSKFLKRGTPSTPKK
mmetsp:Transcript_12089/g.17990  ORF Transcript_12089/g.17990 Transcript_12089/m.17990 type:complete len:1394 (-) Transcript_12089:86-4267(-)